MDMEGTQTTRGTYAEIIGNGTADNARSNAVTIAWNGEAWFSGDVYTGSTSGTNKDAGSKKLATEDYVTSQGYVTTDTKNTAGSTDSSSKLYLIGAISQAANPQTYSDNEVYVQDGVLNAQELTIGSRKSGTTIGTNSSAQGYNITATGSYSHAEGGSTVASGSQSHAEGSSTTASESWAHAEGNNTTASGFAAHAEGQYTTASTNSCHAEGQFTEASGGAAHAEGEYTIASGTNSHAEGLRTTAQRKGQHVEGEWNILDTEGTATTRGTYVHIVGNGVTNSRSNAHTLDWSGNAWFAGDVYTGSTSGTNKDAGSKKLITVDDIPVYTAAEIETIWYNGETPSQILGGEY